MSYVAVQAGSVVSTSYGTGPYVVVEVIRGCTCPSYLDEINMDSPPPSPPHLHLVCRLLDDPRAGRFYLGGLVPDGDHLRSCWNDDVVFVHGLQVGAQFDIFSSQPESTERRCSNMGDKTEFDFGFSIGQKVSHPALGLDGTVIAFCVHRDMEMQAEIEWMDNRGVVNAKYFPVGELTAV